MNKTLFCIFLYAILTSTQLQSQEARNVEKVWRINFLNPSGELESPTGNNSTFSTKLGVGFGGGYPELTYGGSGFIYIFAPFLDLQHKWYYNFEKREEKGKNTIGNSGNYFSLRLLTRGPSIEENVYRTSDFDFAIGPTWGIQRRYGKRFHLLFDIGAQYYFDTEGNGGILPITAQLNLGIDLGN